MILSHILLGSAALTHGGLRLTAKSAGERGEQVSLTIQSGGSLSVAVNLIGGEGRFVAGDIVATVAAGTTEVQLIAALKANADFKKLATVGQASGNGAAIVAPLAKTQFVAAGGLKQRLQTELGLEEWSDRDLIATGGPVGHLSPYTAKFIKPFEDTDEIWEGVFLAGVALQHDSTFEIQNATLDLIRRRLHRAVKLFTHPYLDAITTLEYGYGNVSKDERSGEVFDHARLKVIGTFGIRWVESADDFADDTTLDLTMGLFRNPLDTELAVDAVKDQDIVVQG